MTERGMREGGGCFNYVKKTERESKRERERGVAVGW